MYVAMALGLGLIIVLLVVTVVALIVLLVSHIGLWKIFTKSGRPGWASTVPVYNAIVLLDIIGRPTWWIGPLCLPVVNIVYGVWLGLDLAKVFGKGVWFGLGLVFLHPVHMLILGFGRARYLGHAPPGALPPIRQPRYTTPPTQM